MAEIMKIGDLVLIHYGGVEDLRHVKPTEWFREAFDSDRALVFLGWRDHGGISEPGWADLLHSDGTKKVVHCDYFTKIGEFSK